MPDPRSAPSSASAILEYVSSPGCSDCRAFETLIARLAPEFPTLEVRAVPADSARGLALSVGRGLLRFPIIVLDDKVLAIEAIAEADLRAALNRDGIERS